MPEIDLELFNTLHRIQIRATHLAKNIVAGTYHSAYKGKGIEFEEVREYIPGDDVRSIDWNVTARFGHPYVKNFREERELTVMLIVDLSSSCRFGNRKHPKNRLIAEIAALLAFAATTNNDKVGLLTFSDHIETYLEPKRGKRHVLRIIRDLLVAPPVNSKTDLSKALAFLGSVQTKQAICFIISDFISADFSHELKLLVKRHDVTAIAITDSYEEQFPKISLVNVADLETGEQALIDTSDPQFQQHLIKSLEERIHSLQKLMAQTHGGFLAISTKDSYFQMINHYFKSRGKRLR